MIEQPLFGPADQLKKFRVFGAWHEFGSAFFLFNPQQGIGAVGIDGQANVAFVQQSQRMHYGQKFTYVVGAFFKRAFVNHLLAVLKLDPPVFHSTGIAAARGSVGKCFSGGAGFGPRVAALAF